LSSKTHGRGTVRLVVGAAAAAGLAAGGVLMTAGQSEAATPSLPAHYSAPYLQIESSDAGDLAKDMSASGDKYYSLAFLTPESGCTPEWEDNGDSLKAFTKQVSALQSAGGNVLISFGGASGGELAQTCTSASKLEAAYASVVNDYGVNRLDFDIEGSVLDDSSANTRRDEALAELQKADPSVQIDFTIPVDPTGLESDAVSLLKGAKSAGVKVTIVNIMTMDFGDGQNPLKDAESAATATEKQLNTVYGGSSAADWAMLGLTPIAGQNDDDENFTQSDAKTLESFAASKGVGELAFWELDVGPELPALVVGPKDPAYQWLQGPNLWPDEAMPELREGILAWQDRLAAIAHRLLRELLVSLSAPRGFFDAAFADKPHLHTKLVRYPGRAPDGSEQGVGWHKDYGFLTLLLQDEHGGLEYAYHGPAGDCTSTDYLCQSYNWGYNAAYADVAYADSEGATSRQWWLDIELPTSTSIDPSGADCYQANFWVCDPKLNSTAILGAVTALREQGKEVGVYSTQTQWQAITGGLPLGVPIWIAGFDNVAATYCDPANAGTYWFAAGYPALVQSLPATFDPDTSCLEY